MKKCARILSFVLCIAMVLSVVLSAAFLAANTDHECTGEGCKICCHIQRCEQTLKKVLHNTAGLTGLVFSGMFCVLTTRRFQEHQISETLVSMKVKLSC